MPMKRTIDQWRRCNPHAMTYNQSPAAIQFAFEDAKADILALYALAERVARLNPAAGEIGPGMLASLVEQARGLAVAEAIPLAFLNYRPIYEGDILYGKDGGRLRVVLPLWTKEYPLRLENLDKELGGADYWATDTHYQGEQVIFWEPPHLTNATSST